MKPVVVRRLRLREVASALDSMAEMDLVVHHVNREELRRYLSLSSDQWWQLTRFLTEQDELAHSQ